MISPSTFLNHAHTIIDILGVKCTQAVDYLDSEKRSPKPENLNSQETIL